MYRKPSKPPEKRQCPHCGAPTWHPFCEGYGAKGKAPIHVDIEEEMKNLRPSQAWDVFFGLIAIVVVFALTVSLVFLISL